MKLSAKNTATEIKKTDTLVIFISESALQKKTYATQQQASFLKDTANLSSFKAAASEILFFPFAAHPALIVCGLGKDEEITAETIRNAGAAVTATCRDRGITRLMVFPPEAGRLGGEPALIALAEGLSLANYSFDRYKSTKDGAKKPLVESATFMTDLKDANRLLGETSIVCANTLLCRDLVNETSDVCTPLAISAAAKKLESIPGISCTVLGKKEIEKLKMGLLLAVNRGSEIPPQLVVLKYTGAPASKKYFALVGKGLTFDSGGMNLKPSGHMETMRMDMSGAAVAMYTLKSAAELKLKKNLYAVMPLTENMLSNDSYRPGDIFTAYNGTTVEIGNTDAEGRLILADALSYTVDVLKPECIVDMATLTGACIVTFGETVAAYLTNDKVLADSLERAAESTGDKAWRLPLYPDYEEHMKSDIADLSNISSEKNSGTITGAIFLKNFTGATRWAHLDIAGTAWYSKPRGYRPKNATGYGVRLMTEVIRNWE